MGCYFFQRRKRSALEWNVFWVRRSIGQALSNDALGEFIGAVAVIDAQSNAVVIAEIELRQITMQMLLGAVLVPSKRSAPLLCPAGHWRHRSPARRSAAHRDLQSTSEWKVDRQKAIGGIANIFQEVAIFGSELPRVVAQDECARPQV